MKMKGVGIGFILLSLLLPWVGVRPAFSQQGEPDSHGRRYFPETGHWVVGDFLKTYESVADPLLVYGLPITKMFLEPTQGRWMQYFEKARFVLVPENPPELRVQISDLGRLTYVPGPVLPVAENQPACRRFSETRYRVCFAFREFFEANGGVAQFGYPISSFEIHDQRIVQYFQRARFEWYPELPAGQRVQLGRLGEEYFDILHENSELKQSEPVFPSDNLPQPVLKLRVRAYLARPVTWPSGEQTVYVVVLDQRLFPVADAEVTLVVAYPSGREERIIVPGATDNSGIIKYNLSFRDEAPGLAVITATARYQALKEQGITSFRVWR